MARPLSPSAERVLDRLYLACCALFVAGVFLDGWAHNHVPELESFFTPWHGAFYAGFLATAVTLLGWTLARRERGEGLASAVPPGLGGSLVGLGLFALGGIGDMAWHETFGVEADIEALLSPTHLLLAVGMTLAVGGGVRRHAPVPVRDDLSWSRWAPFLLSLTLAMLVAVFMTQFSEYTDPSIIGRYPRGGSVAFFSQANAVNGAILLGVVLVGGFSLALKRGRPPFGAVTLVLTILIAGLSLMRSGRALIVAAVAAGLIGDVLLRAAWRRGDPRWIRAWTFVLPAAYAAFALAILTVRETVWLTAHMSAGIPVMAGLAGLLTGLVAWPPEGTKRLRGD